MLGNRFERWRSSAPCAKSVDLQQCGEAFAYFIKQFDWDCAGYFDVSILPGDAAYLIHQNNARNRLSIWNCNFKRITSSSACNWTNDTRAGPRIVLPRRQYDRRTMTALLVAKCRIEIDPD